MKIACISDTHGPMRSLPMPEADVLVHAGDLSMSGRRDQILRSLDWLGELSYKTIVLVAGNHDFWAERYPQHMADACFERALIYLQDAGTTVLGAKFWGSPVSPWFHDWAFGPHRGPDIRRHWDMIPEDTDVLITHGPPVNMMDETRHHERVGCEDLRATVKRIQPQAHIFGHIHEGYGQGGIPHCRTLFVNAAMLDERYRNGTRTPIVITVNPRQE